MWPCPCVACSPTANELCERSGKNATSIQPKPPSDSDSSRETCSRRDKASKRAYVWLDGKRKYLGAAESPESYEAYNRLIAELAKNNGRVVPSVSASADSDPNKPVLVAHLIVEFLTAHKMIFTQAEYNQFRYAFRELRKFHAHTPIDKFGPRALKAVRDAMVEAGLSRKIKGATLKLRKLSNSDRF